MTKKVVIGAGPAGLYTAIQLRSRGIRDVVVYDPRAGNYTRPGHLNRLVFMKAGLKMNLLSADRGPHIKDLERELYNKALGLGIQIESKRFLRLHQDAITPGVVVADVDGKEEIVKANYVFDCTGTRREVVSAVNEMVPDSPFKLTTITDLPVRSHFLAYVNISKQGWKESGNALFRSRKISEAIDAYNKALDIYNQDAFIGMHRVKELPIYSNLAIVYLQKRLYSEAIAAAKTALSVFDSCSVVERPAALQEKIVFTLIKAMCAQAQAFVESEKLKDANGLHLQVKNIMCQHESKITVQTLESIQKIIKELQQRLPNTIVDAIKEEENSKVNEEQKSLAANSTVGNLGLFKNPTFQELEIADSKVTNTIY